MDKNEIEIPFGANDSELIESTYHIPDGMEAIIEGDKVIIRKKEGADERVRQDIMNFICWAVDRGSMTEVQRMRYKSWLAWLEKRTKL